jgi:hypothetical protein
VKVWFKLQQLFFDTYLIQTENKENIYIWNTTTDELKPLVAKGHEIVPFYY